MTDHAWINDLRADFPDAVFVEADLARPATLRGIGSAVSGELHSLVHAAGTVDLAPVAETTLESWAHQVNVNLTAPAVLTRELIRPLRTSRGTVLFVNSTAALSPGASWSAYAAAKAGLRALADAVREEEQANGVRVTTVFPSRTATPMQEKVHALEGREYDASRWLRPETVAETLLQVLDLPDDATVPELTLRPRGR